jgi:alpha-tubulin suppressor-like RCC1 family protein
VFARTRDGSIYSWGYNSVGQLGHGHTDSLLTPTKVTNLIPEKAVSGIFCGGYHTLVLDSDGRLWQFGGHERKRWEIPEIFVAAAAGFHHSLALTKNGDVYSWGLNGLAQLGHDNFSEIELMVPTKIEFPNSEHVVCITAGSYNSAAVTKDGRVYTWGMNSSLERTHSRTKKVIPGFQAAVPNSEYKWRTAQWLFLGRSEEDSKFSIFPVEVIFNIVFVIESELFYFSPSSESH